MNSFKKWLLANIGGVLGTITMIVVVSLFVCFMTHISSSEYENQIENEKLPPQQAYMMYKKQEAVADKVRQATVECLDKSQRQVTTNYNDSDEVVVECVRYAKGVYGVNYNYLDQFIQKQAMKYKGDLK